MASDSFKLENIKILNPDSPSTIEVRAVDRSILKDDHVNFILSQVPEVEARIDERSYKPYVGIDLFYGGDAAVKGLVFATQTRALVVRVPDNAAKTSAALYEESKRKAVINKGRQRAKGKIKPDQPEVTVYDRLRKLLGATLAGFGMAQISLTLWDTLHEKVDGVNLSTATSQPAPPTVREIPDPGASIDDEDKETGEQGKNSKDERGRRGGRGRGERGERGGRGRGGRGRGDKGGKKDGGLDEGGGKRKDQVKKLKTITGRLSSLDFVSVGSDKSTVKLPEDEEENWDRPIQSPGQVVTMKIEEFKSASSMDINAVFIGQPEIIDMRSRVAEAAMRAWISYNVADRLNDIIQDAPVVKPSRLTDEELNFFTKSMIAAWKVMGEDGAGRVIERDDIRETDGANKLESRFHKSKIRPGNNQIITLTMNDDTEKTFFIGRPGGLDDERYKHTEFRENEVEEKKEKGNNWVDRGGHAGGGRGGGRGRGRGGGRRRSWQHEGLGDDPSEGKIPDDLALNPTNPNEDPLFNLDEVKQISLYGREDATMPEVGRDAFILRLLEGRGALRGPEYDSCEFIRRVWFPTPAQVETGKRRKLKYDPPPGPQRHDWMDDSWGDDTSEDEALRKKNTPAPNLSDDETEDETVGHDLHINQIPEQLEGQVNPSQLKVIGRITAPLPSKRVRATLVHGPPGTGKTRTIAGAVIRMVNAGEMIWIVAQSNVGIRNVADKLVEVKYKDFILIVAKEYHVWWKKRYSELEEYVISSLELSRPNKRTFERIQSAKMVLCTLASLSNPQVDRQVMCHVPLRHLIIDEASQIDMTSEFMHLFFKYRYCLRSVCWFGDPMQLPPYGWSEDRQINDIFKVEHLKANSRLLDTSYRLPIPIAEYISRDVYGGKLKPHLGHSVKLPTQAVLFIDVPGEERKEENGTSFMNDAEADLVVKIAQLYYEGETTDKKGKPCKYDYEIITPYEAQRALVAKKLGEVGIEKEVYNVDSFQASSLYCYFVRTLIAATQGNEADYIVTTLTKTTFSSFLRSINRLNVFLTRCKKGLVILTRKDFVLSTGGLLRGLWWSMEKENIWASAEDVENGCVDLPGAEAPNEYGSSEEE